MSGIVWNCVETCVIMCGSAWNRVEMSGIVWNHV